MDRSAEQQKLVDFIVTARGTEEHLKAVISGREPSKWLQKYTQKSSMSSSKKSSSFVPVYFKDDKHQKTAQSHLYPSWIG
ncbi:hypothetical protein SKAU_G00067870 [Synaphobranchus kaupii]|uniref:PWWP domain-containing protein n=1 Tax=Synaphobranchus kaupii TaxID=118154 RepID=A0A9Q1G669_SYNKA|nr:hypothetical protein SKAU_G00067870 [Synaphobranchus kaupii]